MSQTTTAKWTAKLLQIVVEEAHKLNPDIDIYTDINGSLWVGDEFDDYEVDLNG